MRVRFLEFRSWSVPSVSAVSFIPKAPQASDTTAFGAHTSEFLDWQNAS
jgi:hypothetical protein